MSLSHPGYAAPLDIDRHPRPRVSAKIGSARTGFGNLRRRRTAVLMDDELLRHGVVHMMARTDAVQLVADMRPGPDAVARLRDLRPELLVLGSDSGARLAELLDGLAPRPSVIVVVDTQDSHFDPVALIRSGADGLIDRRSPSGELLVTLMRVVNGHPALDSASTDAIVARLRTNDPSLESADMPALTRREREVLGLVTDGHDNRTIARHLFISEATVKFHLHNIMAKFGVHKRAALVATALRGNWSSAP
ncbi:response regulator transcription factor [Mycobacterium sp. 236(2023)]|uniref:LuxR C-terminal-related transcriptional regulator n=1 Tax=Mycobacterium sp. 236(2023) TaxID=3038163 RepID=UPI00241524AE|nr:response regulator transcription factor [Mycobacterium sp. 236(2023)]MDG4664029.1 response regulator transcription factor [Mycobacterium sp. 236(2023)]